MLIDVNYFSAASIIRRIYVPFQWLVAPFFYLFTYHFLYREPLKKKQLLIHLAPFILITTIHLIQFIYQVSFDEKYKIAKYYERGLFLYTSLVSFIYIPIVTYLVYDMVLTYEKKYKEIIKKVKQETTWLKNLIHIGIGIMSLGTISAIVGVGLNMKESFYAYPFFIALSLWIYWIGYVGINRSSSYKRLERLSNDKTSKKIGFTTFKKINEFIIEEKKYLTADINLHSIAEKLDLSHGYLSKLINEHTEKNFNDYINELRVNASKKMLLDSTFNNYTIESIGLECGFKSKSNFYTAFKKFTNQTPNQYKKLKE